MRRESIDELVRTYETAAAQHGKLIDRGDSRAANKAHDKVAAAYRELRARSSEAHLLPLLQNSDENVRAWAAAHALEFAPEKGEPVLLKLETRPGLIQMRAKYTLLEWRKGNLKFP